MTNQEAKEQAIKAAYGDYWDRCKDFVGNEGWCSNFTIPNHYPNLPIEYRSANNNDTIDLWRPYEIREIIANNGWTRIEPDGSNLPNSDRWKVCNIENLISESPLLLAQTFPADDVALFFTRGYITHYKPITEEPKPIY